MPIIHTSLLAHLQEGDAYEVVPGTEFTVTRTANRNNTSDYYINSKRVSTKEVTTLLKEKGIDLDNNRFLILQVGAGAGAVGSDVCSVWASC
jgi:chromosome segregation ATPase